MAISSEKTRLKISLHKKALDLIETASRTWNISKSELIETATTMYIVAQVRTLAQESEDLEKKVKEKQNEQIQKSKSEMPTK